MRHDHLFREVIKQERAIERRRLEAEARDYPSWFVPAMAVLIALGLFFA